MTDDEQQVAILKQLHKPNDHHIVEITRIYNIHEITSELLSSGFDIFICDMDLSTHDNSAIMMVHQLQKMDKTMPVIALFPYEDERQIMRALSNGVQDYLVKGNDNIDIIRRVLRYATQRKRYEEKIAYLTMQDHLTGLMNGELVPSSLKQAINSAKREHSLIGVYFIDLDHFKDINDAHGHNIGNALLIDVAARLQSVINDDSILARLSGNTFIIIDIAEDFDACAVMAEEIISAMSVNTQIGTIDLHISASIGVSTYPECSTDASSLLNQAEIALHQAKKQGRGGYRFFTQELNAEATRRIHITSALKTMVNDEMFSLFYQPKINLATRKISGVEALIRWDHPEYGSIRPDQFIPLAEEAGLIQNVSDWVAHTACLQHSDPAFAALNMAINISARELCSHQITDMIAHALENTQMPPDKLVLEITETAMLADTQKALAVMHDLKTLGVRLDIDDFGIGYSSIDYLRRYPVDALKIDRSFVTHMHQRNDDVRVIKLIIDIAHELGLEVIAEGVELYEHLAMLMKLGCDHAQGYYFSRPIPSDQFIQWQEAFIFPDSSVQ